jgi:hypothetical protein
MDGNTYSKSMSNLLQQFSPRFSASYILTPSLNLNFNTGRYYQLPAYTTLGYRDSAGVLVNKNNQLRYISADHLIGGIEYISGTSTRLAAEVFYKTYRHYPFSVVDSISLANKGGDFGVVGDEEVVSTSKGRAYGLELSSRYRVLGDVTGLFSYTYVRSEFQNAAGNYIPSSWDSRHILTLTASKPFQGNWQAGTKVRYVGGLPYTPYDLNQSALVVAWNTQGRPFWDWARFNSARFSDYFQLDIRVDKSFNFTRWSLLVYLDIQNLFNSQAEQPDIILPAVDASSKPIILNPNDPPELQRYQLRTIRNTAGTVLPTIGITVDF